MRTVVGIAIVVLAGGAVAEDLRNEPIERDHGRFIERLLKAVPRGSSMQDAREFVEARGFNCVPREDAEFSKQIPRGDFLLCSRETEAQYFEVALFHEGRTFRQVAMSSRPIWLKPK